MNQSQKTVKCPAYKKELMAELKVRLGSNVVNQVAARCGFSSRYVRYWFTTGRKQDDIKASAFKLLQELKDEEASALAEIKSL
jgi:hypothetical protein